MSAPAPARVTSGEKSGADPQTKATPQIGQLLVATGLINEHQLKDALRNQAKWGSRLGDTILGMGLVKPIDFYRVLAGQLGLEFVNLMSDPAEDALFEKSEYGCYAQDLFLPWRKKEGKLWIATADPMSSALKARFEGRADVGFVVTSKFDVIWELQRVAGRHFSEQAVLGLSEHSPEHSARQVVTRTQAWWFAGLSAIALALLWVLPRPTAIAVNGLINGFLFFSFVFRTALCWISCDEAVGLAVTKQETAALQDADLPLYTVLVPMYKEPTVLPILARALKRMDYPKAKLDIKLVLEEDDRETIEAAKAMGLAANFEIVRVPRSLPRTKPKACNYALRLARGKYLTIYDAEDKPEPDQLKKVVVAFRRLGEQAACVQAHLNYFNAEENWLTRMFTLEYSLWFDMFLPALDELRVPIPLGGTSNHFDLEKLRAVGAWDPFNVTEDADLGLRFAALGYHVGVVNSVTYEEANSQLGNWIRQRSRWIKGYMQTWLVNMRHPIQLFQRVGWRGFMSFQLFVGGSVLSGLVYPLLVIPFLVWLMTRTGAMAPFFPTPVLLISLANLVAGNSCLIYLSMLAVAKRRHSALLPYALTAPAYWFLQSVASYKALWQLMTNPFYWEKTTHGISKYIAADLKQAATGH